MSDDEHDNGEEGDFADWNEEEDEGQRRARCLFSSRTHPSPTAALAHAADAFGFDLRELTARYGLDFYGTIMALNYARTVAKDRGASAGTDDAESKVAAERAIEGIAAGEHRDERFLVPALEDDGVLFEWEEFVGTDAAGQDDDDDDDDDDEGLHGAEAVDDDEDDPVVNAEIAASSTDPRVTAELAKQLSAAIEENDALRLKMLELNHGEPTDDAPTNVGAALLPDGVVKSRRSTAKPVPVKPSPKRSDPRPDRRSALPTVDEDYFGGYGFFDIHRTMLDDVPRTAAYRDALERNPSLMNGAKVLDVGCGTGILSMFAARGGASAVVGVDGAAPMAACARANVAHNGVDDRVSIVQGKVEELLRKGDVQLGGANSYDVLVSEWMGYGLLFESMLDTVIAARDAMLKPGGAVLPDVATIHVAGFGRNATSQPFWDDVYGFEMPAVQADLAEEAAKLAVVHGVKGAHVCTTDGTVKSLDLATMTVLDTEFSSEEVLITARTDGVRGDENDDSVKAGGGRGATGLTQRPADPVSDHDAEPIMCHGIVVWFDTAFSERFCKEAPVVLTTSPHAERTHWAQTLLHFPEPVALVPHGSFWWGKDQPKMGLIGTRTNPAKGIKVRIGMAKCKEEERARGLDISLEYEPVLEDGTPGTRKARMYQM